MRKNMSMSDQTLNISANMVSRIFALRSVWSVMVIIVLAIAWFDPPNVIPTIQFAIMALASTTPYIMVAVFLIAFLKASGGEHTLARAFEGKELQMLIMAAIVGGLAPFCSCEVIPFIAGLIAAGAPLSAIMAFWLSSPLIDPPTFFITAASLGWSFAIAKTIFAVAIGLFGGLVVIAMTRSGLLLSPAKPGGAASQCGCGPALGTNKPVWNFWHETERLSVFKSALFQNAVFLLKWLSLAYLLEALLVHYVPAELIGSLVGGEGILPIMVSALVGAPAYLNSYVAPPLVAGLMEQGMSPGAGMAFMIAGAVSCIPAMVGVYSLVRLPVFASYVTLGLTGAMLSGVVFMWIV